MPGVHLDLIITLTLGLAAALVLGYITQRLKLSPIVGYLLAGIAVGPSTPGYVANPKLAEQMAEVGVILLMFGVGLHFHFRDLLAVRRVAVPGAIVQSAVATVLGLIAGYAFGWSWTAGLVFGLAVSVASTVVLLRVLADNNELHTRTGHIAVGWLIVEDLFTVLVLVMLPVVVQAKEVSPAEIGIVAAIALAKVGLLVAFVFFVGGRVIPWVLAHIARTRSRELFTLTVLVVALGIAVGSATVFGVSMALGAFLAGMVVGRSEFSSRAASEALPMRDAFAVLFFVSVGMLFDPSYLLAEPLVVLATLGVILIGKPLAAFVLVVLMRYPLKVAISVAIALAQIGEFSFILAKMGIALNIFADKSKLAAGELAEDLPHAMDALVAAAILSISLNPLLYRWGGWMEKRLTKSKWLPQPIDTSDDDGQHDDPGDERGAVVVGYGPVGRTLVRMLQENGIKPTIVEMNVDTVHRLRDDGLSAVYGDAKHKETLAEAGAKTAIALVLTSSGMEGSDETIRIARELNPTLPIFARAMYLKELPALRRVGADVVFSGEGEVALTMTEFLLRQLGATEEQIDRERERIRKELFGSPFSMELLLPLPQPKPVAVATKAEDAGT